MNITKIAMSLVTASTAGILLVGGTYAFFTDQGTSTNNIFSAGTLIMKLSDDNETDQDNVTATWGFVNGVPGTPFSGTLQIKNIGTVSAGTIDFDFSNTVVENPDESSPGHVGDKPMDKVLEITQLNWDTNGDNDYLDANENLLPYVHDNNNNLYIDLDDLENTVIENAVFDETINKVHKLILQGRLHQTWASNEHQGDTVTTTLMITLDQRTIEQIP